MSWAQRTPAVMHIVFRNPAILSQFWLESRQIGKIVSAPVDTRLFASNDSKTRCSTVLNTNSSVDLANISARTKSLWRTNLYVEKHEWCVLLWVLRVILKRILACVPQREVRQSLCHLTCFMLRVCDGDDLSGVVDPLAVDVFQLVLTYDEAVTCNDTGWSRYASTVISASFLAELSVSSPRKLLIFII